MKKIDNRQNKQAQRACGRPHSTTARSTYKRNKQPAGMRAKSRGRVVWAA